MEVSVGEDDFSWIHEILAVPFPHFRDVSGYILEGKSALSGYY
jgi:hypothetical protein